MHRPREIAEASALIRISPKAKKPLFWRRNQQRGRRSFDRHVKNFFAPQYRKLHGFTDFARKERVKTFFVEGTHVSAIDESDLVAGLQTGLGRAELRRDLADEHATIRLPPEIRPDGSSMRCTAENRAKRETKNQKERQEATKRHSVRATKTHAFRVEFPTVHER